MASSLVLCVWDVEHVMVVYDHLKPFHILDIFQSKTQFLCLLMLLLLSSEHCTNILLYGHFSSNTELVDIYLF